MAQEEDTSRRKVWKHLKILEVAGVKRGGNQLARVAITRADLSTKSKNDLPDSSFLYVEPGEKDTEGKTTPRSKRHFPVKDASGAVDKAHVVAALRLIPKSDLSETIKNAALKKAQALHDNIKREEGEHMPGFLDWFKSKKTETPTTEVVERDGKSGGADDNDDDDSQPPMPTTAAIHKRNQMHEQMNGVQRAFHEAMYNHMSAPHTPATAKGMKKSVNEYADMMDRCMRDGMKREDLPENIERFMRSLEDIAGVLADVPDDAALSKTQKETIKRCLPEKKQPETLSRESNNKKEKTMKIEDVLRAAESRALTKEEQKFLNDHMTKMQRDVEDAKKTPATEPEKPATAIEVVKRAAEEGKLDPKVATAIDEIVREAKTKEEAIANVIKRVDAMEKEKETMTFQRTADEFKGIGLDNDVVLDMVKRGDPGLKALRAIKAKQDDLNKKLFDERGVANNFARGAEGSASDEIEKKATEKLKADTKGELKGSMAIARDAVRRENPELKQREDEEQHGG